MDQEVNSALIQDGTWYFCIVEMWKMNCALKINLHQIIASKASLNSLFLRQISNLFASWVILYIALLFLNNALLLEEILYKITSHSVKYTILDGYILI